MLQKVNLYARTHSADTIKFTDTHRQADRQIVCIMDASFTPESRMKAVELNKIGLLDTIFRLSAFLWECAYESVILTVVQIQTGPAVLMCAWGLIMGTCVTDDLMTQGSQGAEIISLIDNLKFFSRSSLTTLFKVVHYYPLKCNGFHKIVEVNQKPFSNLI